jgi:hypothetical protein
MIPAMLPKIRGRVAGVMLTAAVLACCPATARADAGIPMLPVSYQTMVFFLLLVIIIEVIYLQARLRTRFRRTLMAVSTVNAAAMGLGFPLAWLIYIVLDSWGDFPGGQSGVFSDMQFVPLWVCTKIFPDWIGTHDQVWPIMGIFVTLLVPSYLFTRILKSWVFSWYDLLRYDGDIKPAVLMANRLSYLLLAITGCMLLFRTFHIP